ncbi:MAG TPA: long-chain fatty acid--CoA ligase [Verrucomicrobiae bacterium]|jgi:long-chain acyl-CoA synthetase|nr:long-chain fatty acid--CoA ligase [Verrucomicrobiae bacterium]
MEPQTLNDIFFSIVNRRPERVMLVREGTTWVPIGSQDFYRNIAGIVRAMAHWGVGKGDRVAILSENRPEWAFTDFACQLMGAVSVPIYATLTAPQTAYILADSGATVAVVSTLEQLKKVVSIRQLTALKKIVVMDSVETAEGVPMRPLLEKGPNGRDSELEARAGKIGPDDLATIIYTSGTTGTSKGVQLTHRNFASNLAHSMDGFEVGAGHVSVSFLPLSHVTARHADIALLSKGVVLAYCPCFEQLPQTLMEVRPTVFVGVPRVYEKIYLQLEQKTKSAVKRAVYHWALALGRDHQTEILEGKSPASIRWNLANRTVYSKLRTALGGRVEIFVSGGAPLGKELAEWYASMGIRIHEGYGLTETSPVIAINNPQAHRLGTVGRPLANVEVKIAQDSEILVRGPSVFRAYWNRPEETRSAFVDGWFKTGDIGRLDEDGFLSVTDRKKDLLKTSGGKFIAPQPIENSLKLNALIGSAVVVGDRRKFASVLISPQFPALEDWAREHHVPFTTRERLVTHPKVTQLYHGIVGEVNRGLARYETLKKVLLVPDEFSSVDGTLTPTLKLRRMAIEERYRQQIDELYQEERPA